MYPRPRRPRRDRGPPEIIPNVYPSAEINAGEVRLSNRHSLLVVRGCEVVSRMHTFESMVPGTGV